FVVDDTARGIHRMTALVLDGAAAREMLDMAFLNARLLQKSLAPGASLEDLFAWTARTGSASVVGHGTSSAFRSKPLEEPIYGLTLAVGPTPSAVGYLEFGADPLTERLTMLLLMGVIGALLVLAMLQVRRETELSRLRADFVSGVSHELRTPLAQIRMFTETLLMG